MLSPTTRAVIEHYRNPFTTLRLIGAETTQIATDALKTLQHFTEVFRPTPQPEDAR